MVDASRQKLGLLARLVVAFGAVLVVVGIVRYGVTIATIQRVFRQLVARPSGPLSFRFILQPLMAAIAAIHDGRKDVQAGRSPFVWTMLMRPNERIERLNEGLNATARIILLGIVVDAIYQVIALNRFYPTEAVIIALLLAFVPYVILRELIARVLRRVRASRREVP